MADIIKNDDKMSDRGSFSGGGGGDKSPSGSSTSSKCSNNVPGLYLTLPSNFSPVDVNQQQQQQQQRVNNNIRGKGCSPVSSSSSSSSTLLSSSSTHHHHHHHHNHHTWEDLRRLFLVSLEKLSRLEPESLPFRQPVDPIALGIPDYTDIIRKPMDLQTIRLKMNNGKYTEPYAYVDDVLRMLDNALVYNRESSKVYNYALKLAEVFMVEVNPVLMHLGLKKGRSNGFQFNSDVVTCHGRPVCLVFKGQGYWKGTGVGLEFNLCEKCYECNMSADDTSIIPDLIPQQQQTFVFTFNNSKVYSPAAELHKSHLRDAEMSRQLVLREFLRMLMENNRDGSGNENVWKMLKCNGKLMGEFKEYVKRRRVSNAGGGGGGDCYGEYRNDELDVLIGRLENV